MEALKISKLPWIKCKACSGFVGLADVFPSDNSYRYTEFAFASQGSTAQRSKNSPRGSERDDTRYDNGLDYNESFTETRFSRHFQTKNDLELILTNPSVVEGPLCESCGDQICEMMDERVASAKEELRCITLYLQEPGDDINEAAMETLRKEVRALEAEDQSLQIQINEMMARLDAIKDNTGSLGDAQVKVSTEVNSLIRESNLLQNAHLDLTKREVSLEAEVAYHTTRAGVLEASNAISMAFRIQFDETFGYINGFRLGRSKAIEVQWNEINIAWGQAALLLNSLADCVDVKFTGYRVVPFGNYSVIEATSDKGVTNKLPLYYIDGKSQPQYHAQFDRAVVAYAKCLTEVMNEIELRTGRMHSMPHAMVESTIADRGSSSGSDNEKYSIMYQMNSEERWTRALRYMLENLHWAVMHYDYSLKPQDDNSQI